MAREIPRTEAGQFACKLTPELARRLVEGVESGLFDQQNALRCGVDVTTLKSWVFRGLDEEAVEPFRSFAEAYITAAIALEARLLQIVRQAADPWVETKEEIEITSLHRGFDETDFGEVGDVLDSLEQGQITSKKVARTRASRRGDWKAAAWVLERRWPLRWSSSRQPDGGPKEAIPLPDGALNRRRRVSELTSDPSPEMIKAFRDKGFAIVRITDASTSAAVEPKPGV